MSRRSRRLARQRLHRNQRARRRTGRLAAGGTFTVRYRLYGLYDIPFGPRWFNMAVNPYYAAAAAKRSQLDRELALADRMAAHGFDMRDEHNAIASQTEALERVAVVVQGRQIEYAEIDGVPICITQHGWCEREFGHPPPHVYDPKEKP